MGRRRGSEIDEAILRKALEITADKLCGRTDCYFCNAEDLCQRHPGSPSPLETKPPKKEEETMPKLKPQAIKDKGQQLDVRPRRSPKRAGQSALMTTGRPAHRLQTLQDFLGKWADACAREHLRDTGVDCPECEDYAACQKWGDRVITSIMYRDKRFRHLQTGGTG